MPSNWPVNRFGPSAVAEGADAIATTARIAARLHKNLCADGVEVLIDESREGEKKRRTIWVSVFRSESNVGLRLISHGRISRHRRESALGTGYRCNGRSPELVRGVWLGGAFAVKMKNLQPRMLASF